MSYAHNRFLDGPSYVSKQDGDSMQRQIDGLTYKYLITVEKLTDFPTPIAGVIQLVANTTYLVTTTIDLMDNVIDCSGGKVAIIGESSEISLVSSTNIGAMITSDDTVVLRWISLTSTLGSVFSLDAENPASGNTNAALDWFGLNILDSPDMGTIANYSNVIGFSMGILNSSELEFDGTFGTVAFDTCIFTTPLGSSLVIAPTCIITRRFRIQFSAFVTTGVNNSISVDAGATIDDEQYILFRNNFSGGATNFLDGVQSSDDKANHKQNFGVSNSRAIAHYYMSDNKDATDCIDSKYVKIAGTTTSGALHQRFTQTSTNRATYNGAESAIFKLTTTISLTDGNNIDYGTRVGVNGTTLVDSTSLFTSTGEGKASNISSQAIIELQPDDYVEMFVANLTSDADPISISLSVILTKVDT